MIGVSIVLGSKQDSFYANLSIFKCCTSKQMTVLNISLFFKEHQSGPTWCRSKPRSCCSRDTVSRGAESF